MGKLAMISQYGKCVRNVQILYHYILLPLLPVLEPGLRVTR